MPFIALPGASCMALTFCLPVQDGNESGTVDEPSNEPQGLHEPETEDIKTVPAGSTIYSSATSFEDLHLSPELLQVQQPCQPNASSILDWTLQCQSPSI